MEVVKWIRRTHPDYWIAAIPNGGGRSKADGAKLKCEGVSAGFPDLIIPKLKMFVEMKKIKDYVVSKEQKDWLNYLTDCGYTAVIAYGHEDAIKKISEEIKKHGEGLCKIL